MDWAVKRSWAIGEHDARRRAAFDGREDFRLAGIAGASWAAGLASLMLGDGPAAREWLRRAADEYGTSWRAAPAGSWGRPIAILRCLLLAGDHGAARVSADEALAAGVLDAPGPIGGYCAALALLVHDRDEEAEPIARRIVAEGLEPAAVGLALGALARRDPRAYEDARRGVLRSFDEREAFLEDVPVADTVLVLDALAEARGMSLPPLHSPLLPGD